MKDSLGHKFKNISLTYYIARLRGKKKTKLETSVCNTMTQMLFPAARCFLKSRSEKLKKHCNMQVRAHQSR